MKKTCLYAALMSSILLSGCALGASPTQTPLAGSTGMNAPSASVSGYEVQAFGIKKPKKFVFKKPIKKDANDKKKDKDDKDEKDKDEDKKKKENKRVYS